MQLIQRLTKKYAEEIRQSQDEVPSKVQSSFLFEVFCNPTSQLVNQCQMSQVRAQRFTRERNDLETAAGRRELFQELVRHRPTHVWFAPTCTVWSGWASLNGSRSISAYEQLTAERVRMLQQVALGIALLRHQRHHGRHMHWEQPQSSMMTRLACLKELRQLCHQANFEMCVAGDLRCPQSGLPIRKATTVFTTHEALFNMLQRQRCNHSRHQTIEGCVRVDGERLNRSRFSESYTRKFARQVIQVLRQDKGHQRQDPGWALAADDESLAPAAKRMRRYAETPSVSRRPAPTPLLSIGEPKRQRIEGKQPEPREVQLRDLVKEIHGKTPRVGKIEISSPDVLEKAQAVFPDRQVIALVACRGTDRTIGPPDRLSPQEARWRRAIMVRRHDGALTMETQWEDISQLPKGKIVRTNLSCKLNITVFARDIAEQNTADPSSRSSEEQTVQPQTQPVNREFEVPPAGCSLDRVQAEVSDLRQGWAYRQLSLGERQWLAKIHKNLGHPHADRLASTL